MTAEHYLSVKQVAKLIGVHSGNVSAYKMPPPDAYIGDRRGWKEDTIVRWNANRPGHGGRPMRT